MIIKCEKCLNLHLIADNLGILHLYNHVFLGWFEDKKVNIEDIINRQGDSIQKIINEESIQFLLNEQTADNSSE